MNRNLAENRRGQANYRHLPRDEWRRRAIEFAKRGEELAKKLSESDVIAIRSNKSGLTDKEQAMLYGVHPNTIYKIRKRLIWELV